MQSTPSKRYQQLQPEDRVTLASLAQQKYSVRAMAQDLGRSPRTIKPAGYASTTARTFAQRRRLQGRPPGKLHRDGILFGLMRHCLNDRWSPEQIALTLAGLFPEAMSTACHTRPSASVSSRGRAQARADRHPRPLGGRPDQGAARATAVGSLVERTSRLLMLIKLSAFKPASAANPMQAFSDKLPGSQPPCAGA
jgi:IS30 family transposase